MDSFEFLRLHREPCVHFDEQKIHHLLMAHTNAFMDTLERFYCAWRINGRMVLQPRKQVFTTRNLRGDLRVMPCIIDNFEGQTIKAVKVIGTNEEEKIVQDKIAVGKALLINADDNFVEAIFDVGALSSFRTAAISILAYRHSGHYSSQNIGFIGAGRIAFYGAVILHHWLGIKEISVYDIDGKRTSRFAQVLNKTVKINEETLADLCKAAKALFLSTTSAEPILSAGNIKGVNFVSSVGADADNLSELDQSVIDQRLVISESKQNIHFGDLGRWRRAGIVGTRDILELRQIVGLSRRAKKPVVFVSTGAALQDALICRFLYSQAQNAL